MKFYFSLVVIAMLVLAGCTYQQRIYIDGQPIVSNISYSSSPSTGISTSSILIKKSKKHEGDEEYIDSEYFSPVKFHTFKNVYEINYIITINNSVLYRKTGKGFYYKAYKVIKVTNHKKRTLAKNKELIYSGHLSYKNFMINLPRERGDEVVFYIEFRDKKDEMVFRTLEVSYKIK